MAESDEGVRAAELFTQRSPVSAGAEAESSGEHPTFTADLELELRHALGTQRRALSFQLQRILLASEAEGYSTTLADSTHGIVNIRRNGVTELHLRLGPENLVAGRWEEKVATLYAQLQSWRLLEDFEAEFNRWNLSSTHPDRLRGEEKVAIVESFKRVLGLSPEHSVTLVVEDFPGARQVQVYSGRELIAGMVRSLALGLLLEFRLNPKAFLKKSSYRITTDLLPSLAENKLCSLVEQTKELFEHYQIPTAAINSVRAEINSYGRHPEQALRIIGRTNLLKVLCLGEFNLGFGDPHRRLGIRLVDGLPELGFSHLAVELPHDLSNELQQSLAQRSVAALGRLDVRLMNVEYSVLLQRAYDAGLVVVAIGEKDPSRAELVANNIKAVSQRADCTRILFWTDALRIACEGEGYPLSIGAHLQRALGAGSVVTVAGVSHQLPNSVLKQITEGPYPEDSLQEPAILPMRKCLALADLPLSLAHPVEHRAWDYIIVYPGSDSRFSPS